LIRKIVSEAELSTSRKVVREREIEPLIIREAIYEVTRAIVIQY
jgi:hypothetical protein